MNTDASTSPTPTTPPEHERCEGRGRHSKGFYGLGHTPKQRHVTGENASLPGAFHNDHDAQVRYQRETPAKRQMVEYAMQGFNNKEIANLLGTTTFTVSQTLRQPWAREYMINTMRQDSLTEVQELLKKELLPSIELLVELRDNDQLRPEVRAGIAERLADRVLGKAAQPILSGKIEPAKMSDEELQALARNGTLPNNGN